MARATKESLEFIILSRILEKVWRRTMTGKDEGESYVGFPGLSSTMPSALLRVRAESRLFVPLVSRDSRPAYPLPISE